jgi:hypothetical protein
MYHYYCLLITRSVVVDWLTGFPVDVGLPVQLGLVQGKVVTGCGTTNDKRNSPRSSTHLKEVDTWKQNTLNGGGGEVR